MGQSAPTTMDDAAVAAFLDARRTGVLSLADGSEAYAVPVAFTFEPESEDFFFRLGYGPESLKRAFVGSTDRATFVVHGETDSGWRSVVARGRLEELSTVSELRHRRPRGTVGPEVQQAVRELEVPFYQVFDDPDSLEFTLARLDTDEVTGVVETTDGGGE